MQSDQINELAEALSKAQGAIEGAVKDAKNPFFKSNYADLHSVIACAKAPLSENGLAVIQTTGIIDAQLCMMTTLAHKSGQWIRAVMPIMLQKQDAQSMGSALTYLRRYSYQAICGISAMDDDGNAATDKKEIAEKPQPKPIEGHTLADLILAMAKGGDLIKQSRVAGFVTDLCNQRKTTSEAIIKSALSSEENLERFKKSLMKFNETSTPEPEAIG